MNLETANIFDNSLSIFFDINRIVAIEIYAWDTILVTSVINISIIGDINYKGVYEYFIININNNKGEIIFRGIFE